MKKNSNVLFLMELAKANQEVAAEKRNANGSFIADFDGVVQGHWVKISEDNSGVVEYNGVEYNTIMQGRKSIPKGTKVSLQFRQGHYISSW